MGLRASGAVFALFLCGSACSGVDPRAVAAVEVVNKATPPPSCRALGLVDGKDSDRWSAGGMTYARALADLRKKAAEGGGNYVVVDDAAPPREGDYMPAFIIHGRLFACPSGALAAPAASSAPVVASASPPPAKVACEPECSPGYTCLRGTCVSACNPLCSAGERCGQDRVCHPIAASPAPSSVPP